MLGGLKFVSEMSAASNDDSGLDSNDQLSTVPDSASSEEEEDPEDLNSLFYINPVSIWYLPSQRGQASCMVVNNCMYAVAGTIQNNRNRAGRLTIPWCCQDRNCSRKTVLFSERVVADEAEDKEFDLKI